MKSVRLFGLLLCATALVPCASAATFQINEGFDDITTLAGAGWTIVNNSAPVGQTSWFQGTAALTAPSGNADSYIAANFNAADFSGNISLWLASPEVTLANGVALSFYTASTQGAPDRLEVRYSTSGPSSNVGATDTSVGDFSSLLLTINPTLAPTGYPADWALGTATISGLSAPVSGRFAFRYVVPDTSINGDFIGIDTVRVSAPIPEPSGVALSMLGLAALLSLARNRRKRNSQ
jgi:hypothetical protein